MKALEPASPGPRPQWRIARQRAVRLQTCQLIAQLPRRLIAAAGIFLQTFADDALQSSWCVPGTFRFRFDMQNSAETLTGSRSRKRQPAGCHLIEDYSQTEDVRAVVDIIPEDLFRAHIVDGPHDDAGRGCRSVRGGARR